MNDLFDETPGAATQIALPDARLTFFHQALDAGEARAYFDELRQGIAWDTKEIVVYGKRHPQPRLVAWYGEPEARYTYSGSTLDPLPWTPALARLRARVEALAGARFNSVLLNLYRDGNDRMGWHSDSEAALGREPVIASLSLGAARLFQMKHRTRPELGTQAFELTAGSLLVMAGPTQHHWVHAVRRESRPVGVRINLTFRWIFAGV